MPWVRRHRRHTPYSWFRTTTVRSHYRSRSGNLIVIVIVAVLAVILLLILIF